MNTIFLFPRYIQWHYGRAWKDLSSNAASLVFFVGSFFSFTSLFRTLFLPWKRLGETYEKGLDAEKLISTFLVNMITRVLGFVLRSVVIVFGMILLLVSFVVVGIAYVVWAVVPLLILFLFALGISSLLL